MATVSISRRRECFCFWRRTMIEVDGDEVGGVWIWRELKIEVSPGPHTFQAFMAWVASSPLKVDVQQDGTTTLGVRAPFREAQMATGLFRPVGPQRAIAKPDHGLELWEYSRPTV